ncbi:BMP-binding endothelial regulator protein-like [Ptychodera flava]|uniref:BMP-binding endothelial regulator protein-like n=1 Tax=Ptychodera flava TaxID=63121 RepID=UPI00396A92DF
MDVCRLNASGKRDPHLSTFSGKKYSFQGYCSYTLVRDCSRNTPYFDISADFRGRFQPTQPPTRMVSVTVRIDEGDAYTFLEDHTILVNDRPVPEKLLLIGEDNGYIQHVDGTVEMHLKKDDVFLKWNGKNHEASVSIGNKDLAGKLCGMFGDGSKVKGHDLLKSDGTKTFNTTEFAESWVIKGSCP